MTKISKNNFYNSFEEFLKGNYKIDFRKFLEINFKNKKYYGLNEISILKSGIKSRIIDVSAYDGEKLINTYKGDGIIVSTATGSTAYSLSAGGPIISPNLDIICITPLAPLKLGARSLLLDANKSYYFSSNTYDGEIGLNIDGNFHVELEKNDVIEIKLSDKGISLIYIDDSNYYEILKNKLNWT